MLLRPYQDALVHHTTRALWNEGKRRLVWCLPVGAGKTPCAVALITRMRAADWAAVYFLAHTAELVTQPGERLRGAVDFGFMKAGLLGDPTAPVQVGSVQTAVRRALPPLPRLDGSPHRRCVVFVDEGHRCRSSTYHAILARLGESYEFVYLVIMTATPYRRDGRGLADVADALVEAVTPREMFAAGWLVDPAVYSRPPTAPGAADSVAADSAAQVGIVGDVVTEWSARDEGKPWVARCVNRAHARDVAARLAEAGARTAHIDGTMPETARELLLARLAIGGRASDHPLALDVLCSGGTILEEGFDSASSYRHVLSRPWMWSTRAAGDPPPPGSDGPGGVAPPSVDDAAPRYRPLFGLIDAAPTSSRGAWIQRVGRVDRPFTAEDVASWAERGVPADEKRSAVVLCHSGNLERHGFLAQHEDFQLTGDRTGAAPVCAYPRYRPPAVASCAGCFASVARGSDCPACGLPSPPSAPSLPDERKSVRLERADPTAAPPVVTDEQREAFLRGCWASWSRARASALAAGRKPPSPWQPAAIYRKKFGSWPDRGLDSAIGRQFGARR